MSEQFLLKPSKIKEDQMVSLGTITENLTYNCTIIHRNEQTQTRQNSNSHVTATSECK